MTTQQGRIQRVGTVCVFVEDQDRAKAFYTQVLGMELRTDQPLYPGAEIRWIAVAPPGAETELILYVPDENWAHYRQVVGKPQAISLTVENLAALHTELRSKGVIFISEPEKQPWGTFAMIQDSEGNGLLLVEH